MKSGKKVQLWGEWLPDVPGSNLARRLVAGDECMWVIGGGRDNTKCSGGLSCVTYAYSPALL